MKLGRKIKLARMAKGWSQEKLAEKIQKTRGLISHIENTGKANSYTLEKITRLLNIDVSTVRDDETENSSEFYLSEKINTKQINDLKEKIKLLEELRDTQKELISIFKNRLKNRK